MSDTQPVQPSGNDQPEKTEETLDPQKTVKATESEASETPATLEHTAGPPPHPFAASSTRPPRSRTASRVSIGVGLGVLICCSTAAFFFNTLTGILVIVIIGAAILLGLIAIITRNRPIIFSILSVLVALLTLILYVQTGLFTPAPNSDQSHKQPAPEPPKHTVVEWPRNMASGGIALTAHDDTITALPFKALPPNSAPTPDTLQAVTKDHPHIRLYVDYRCPVCSIFESTHAHTIEQAIRAGAVLEITPLRFLDRVSTTEYSSRASAAMACLADTDPETVWPAHQALLDQKFQPAEDAPDLSNDELVNGLDQATGGLKAATRECVQSERFVPFAKALDTWVFSHPVPGAKDPDFKVTGTPLVTANGVPFTGGLTDERSFRDFLTSNGVKL